MLVFGRIILPKDVSCTPVETAIPVTTVRRVIILKQPSRFPGRRTGTTR